MLGEQGEIEVGISFKTFAETLMRLPECQCCVAAFGNRVQYPTEVGLLGWVGNESELPEEWTQQSLFSSDRCAADAYTFLSVFASE